MKNATTLKAQTMNAIAAKTAEKKLATLASILWDLGLASTRENIAAVRFEITALRNKGAIATRMVGNDIAYTAK